VLCIGAGWLSPHCDCNVLASVMLQSKVLRNADSIFYRANTVGGSQLRMEKETARDAV